MFEKASKNCPGMSRHLGRVFPQVWKKSIYFVSCGEQKAYKKRIPITNFLNFQLGVICSIHMYRYVPFYLNHIFGDWRQYLGWDHPRRSLIGNVTAYLMSGHSSSAMSNNSNKTKHEKVFLRQLPLNSLLAETLWVNKITTKNCSKIYRSKSILKCRSCHLWIKLTHRIQVVWEHRL